MIKLTKDDIEFIIDKGEIPFPKEQTEQLKEQILDDYEKARKLDSYHYEKRIDKLQQENKQNQKLRELIEKRQEKWKKASRMTEEQIYAFDELQKLLNKSKK